MSSIFREKNLEEMNSPEQLNDYVRVLTPRAWMLIIAIVLLLGGIMFWSVFGHIESKIQVPAECDEGKALVLIKSSDISKVKKGSTIVINNQRLPITGFSDLSEPFVVNYDNVGDYARQIGNLVDGETFYVGYSNYNYDSENLENCPLMDGIYSAEVIVEDINPISFIFN